jgi:excisionase family DNA binding protein
MADRDDSEWLTLGEAARFLGVAQSTIRKWSDGGRVPAFYTPGGHRRYRRADLEAFLQRSGPRSRPKRGPLVLVVDDDARMRDLVRVNLELEGYLVGEAGGADEGLAAIERLNPEVVLVEATMPHVDGWELLRRIRERYGGAGSIPVVMYSSKPDGETTVPAEVGAAQAFVAGPFDLQELLEQTKRFA